MRNGERCENEKKRKNGPERESEREVRNMDELRVIRRR